MLPSGMKCYHLGWNVIIWDEMLSSGANVIIWNAMLSSWANVIIWDKVLSFGANVVMLSFGANVIIWCYHVMLSSGMITPPFFIFPENFTHSFVLSDSKSIRVYFLDCETVEIKFFGPMGKRVEWCLYIPYRCIFSDLWFSKNTPKFKTLHKNIKVRVHFSFALVLLVCFLCINFVFSTQQMYYTIYCTCYIQ